MLNKSDKCEVGMGSFLPNKIISKPSSNNSADSLNFIDLFCGCGGFTLGMERSGFKCLAAIDFNAETVAILHANLPHIKHVLHRDLTAFGPDELWK
ncbi:MAG: DNA cytosine methyltransferase [Gemmatimonadaceae bacterium]|nr:DNA cytosine methyltransferase [Chitinophagaceae bacterium]